MSKEFDDDVISTNRDVIIFFRIYGQFAAIPKLDSGRVVYKTMKFFINNNLLSYKNWKQNWKISNTTITLLFWVKVPFLVPLLKGVYFLKLHMCVYLRTKFQVSSVILTSLRQGVILPPSHTAKRTPKKSTFIRVKRNYKVLMSKSPCFLLNENTNFNKNMTESKMENPTHSFRDKNFVLQLI